MQAVTDNTAESNGVTQRLNPSVSIPGEKLPKRNGPIPVKAQMLDNIGIDALCDMIMEGMSISDISRKTEVSRGVILGWIAADVDRSARIATARTEAAKLWDEMAEERLDEASDMFELSKAKELAHHYRWRASKFAPKLFGEKVQTETTLKVEVDIAPRKDQLRQMLDINQAPAVEHARKSPALPAVRDVETVEAVTIADNVAPQRTMKSAAKTVPVSPDMVQRVTDQPERKPMSNAERQAAYRARKKQG